MYRSDYEPQYLAASGFGTYTRPWSYRACDEDLTGFIVHAASMQQCRVISLVQNLPVIGLLPPGQQTFTWQPCDSLLGAQQAALQLLQMLADSQIIIHLQRDYKSTVIQPQNARTSIVYC